MKRISGVTVLCFGLAFMCVAGQGFAIGGNEVERMYYTCPENSESLAECTHEGTFLKLCTGTIIVEGMLVGNYQMVHTESCDGTAGASVCEYGFACDWTWFVDIQEYKWVCNYWELSTCLTQ